MKDIAENSLFRIPEKILPPSPGQGAIAIQCLKNSFLLKDILYKLNDQKSFLETLFLILFAHKYCNDLSLIHI